MKNNSTSVIVRSKQNINIINSPPCPLKNTQFKFYFQVDGFAELPGHRIFHMRNFCKMETNLNLTLRLSSYCAVNIHRLNYKNQNLEHNIQGDYFASWSRNS